MKAIHLPHYQGITPYVSGLAGALGSLGVTAQLWHPSGWLPMLSAVRHYGRPDVLHLHWLHEQIMRQRDRPTWFRMLRLAAELSVFRLLGVRVVWTIHNLLAHETNKPELELKFNGWIARRFCDRLIVHSEAARAAVIAAYRLPESAVDKIAVIPHPGYVGVYPTGVSREQARRQFGLEEDERVFLFLGKLRMYKGLNRALEAFHRMPGDRLRFIVAGYPKTARIGNELHRIRRRDQRIMLRLELLPPEDLQLYMAAADVVVLPFLRILTSGSLLLAMTFGKPVVVPDLEVIRESVDEEGAIFFDGDSDADLERALTRAAHLDSASLARMGERNYAAANEHSREDSARRTYAVYERCLSRPAS